MTASRSAALLLLLFSAPSRAAEKENFVAALRGVLLEDHVDVRDPAWILTTSGFKVEEVVAELSRLLPGLDAPSALEAEYILGRLGARAAAAVPALIERLASSSDPDVRWGAVRALGQIGPAARQALGAIAAAASEPNADLRAAAIKARKQIAPEGSPAQP